MYTIKTNPIFDLSEHSDGTHIFPAIESPEFEEKIQAENWLKLQTSIIWENSIITNQP